ARTRIHPKNKSGGRFRATFAAARAITILLMRFNTRRPRCVQARRLHKERVEMAQAMGFGHSVKRKEDARFLRGRGNYIEDIKLPGMLWLALFRSPFRHRRHKK